MDSVPMQRGPGALGPWMLRMRSCDKKHCVCVSCSAEKGAKRETKNICSDILSGFMIFFCCNHFFKWKKS